jgi:hypothetical protein
MTRRDASALRASEYFAQQIMRGIGARILHFYSAALALYDPAI